MASRTLDPCDVSAAAFYGIIVQDTDLQKTFKTDVVRFNRDDFYFTADSDGRPIVNVAFEAGVGGSGADGNDQIGTLRESEADGTEFLSADTLVFNTASGFYLTPAPTGSDPIINLHDHVVDVVAGDNVTVSAQQTGAARTITVNADVGVEDIPPGFYGINVGQSDDIPLFSGVNTVKFEAASFYVTQNDSNTDEVQVNFRGIDTSDFATKDEITPGFYGILLQDTDLDKTFKTKVIRLNRADFYITEDSDGRPVVSIAFEAGTGGGADGNDQIGTVRESEANGTSFTSADTLIFDTDSGFYLSSPSTTINFHDHVVDVEAGNNVTVSTSQVGAGKTVTVNADVSLSDIPPGFYGIVIEESDGSPSLKDDTLRFLTGDFVVSEVSNKPQVSLDSSVARLTDIGPGFYGIVIAETDGSPSYSGINKVNFNSSDFYVTQNAPNTDEVQINFRGLDPSSGEANTASNLGAGEGVFAQKSGVDLQFKSLVGGTNVTLSSDSNEITINSSGGGAASGFYGINVGQIDDNPLYKNINTVKFHVDNFYVTQNSPNTDEVIVNFRGTASPDNFSYNRVEETITVPRSQQMAVFETLDITSNGSLILEGSVVLNI